MSACAGPRVFVPVLLSALLASAACAVRPQRAEAAEPREPARPNIVLLLADDKY